MGGHTRSALFLMEQLIVILVFAISSAVCAQIFTASLIKAGDARDLSHALIAVKNGAEAFRAYGTPKAEAEVIGGSAEGPDSAVVWYDKGWRVCEEPEAAYLLRMSAATGEDGLPLCELTAESVHGAEIFGLTAARRGFAAEGAGADNIRPQGPG